MLTHTTPIISNMDPIKYIFEKAALSGRIARWQMLLLEHAIKYHTQKRIEGSVLDDHLDHEPIDDEQSSQDGLMGEEIMYLKVKNYEEPLPEEGPELGS